MSDRNLIDALKLFIEEYVAIDDIESRMDGIESKIDDLESNYEEQNEQISTLALDGINIDDMANKMKELSQEVDNLKAQIDKLMSKKSSWAKFCNYMRPRFNKDWYKY